jgi:hypothetical protein
MRDERGTRIYGRSPTTEARRATLKAIGCRLHKLRCEFGGSGRYAASRTRFGLDLPRKLGISERNWYNWESGIVIPGDQILEIIVATGVRPRWLLHGQGPMFAARRRRIQSAGEVA